MVGRYQAAKSDIHLASQLLLASRGIVDPTIDQSAGAMLDAEFKLRVIRHLGGGK